jgi:hypothetical protein
MNKTGMYWKPSLTIVQRYLIFEFVKKNINPLIYNIKKFIHYMITEL